MACNLRGGRSGKADSLNWIGWPRLKNKTEQAKSNLCLVTIQFLELLSYLRERQFGTHLLLRDFVCIPPPFSSPLLNINVYKLLSNYIRKFCHHLKEPTGFFLCYWISTLSFTTFKAQVVRGSTTIFTLLLRFPEFPLTDASHSGERAVKKQTVREILPPGISSFLSALKECV